MHTTPFSLALLLALARVTDGMSDGPQGHGRIGYGIDMYTPVCATACRDVTPKVKIHCDEHDHDVDEAGMIQNSTASDEAAHDHQHAKRDGARHDHRKLPSNECLASSTPYLQTIAWCISTHCPSSVNLAEREEWWHYRVVDRLVNPPTPNMTYARALASISAPPNATAADQEMLVGPVLVDEAEYIATFNGNDNFQTSEVTHSRLSLVIIASCALLPILLSLLRFLPIPVDIASRFRSTFIDAPLIPRPVHLPLIGRVAIPSRGQSIFLAYIVLVNVHACSIQYTSAQPSSFFKSARIEVMSLIANRTGAISMANLPLLILFAGRNNFLMWLTDWSHATFLLLHRAVALMCSLEAILHSILYLRVYIERGPKDYHMATHMEYWTWGIVATVALCVMPLIALRRLRATAYEAFLIAHIIGAVITLVGLWYHITILFKLQWGYDLWIFVSIAVWGFDRLFRVLRFVRHGAKLAVAYRIDDEYLRIDIPNVHATGHVYLYFPTLTWKVWENHPFSVAAHNTLPPTITVDEKIGDDSSASGSEVTPTPHLASRNRGISLLIRHRGGITSKIARRAVPIGGTPVPFRVLVESSYGGNTHLTDRTLHDYPNMLLISGGVGITPILPIIAEKSHQYRLKLYWETRSAALVEAAKDLMDGEWGGCETKVFVDERMDLREIIAEEVKNGPTMMLVSGPNKMMAEVRRLVAKAGQKGSVVQYAEESFDW